MKVQVRTVWIDGTALETFVFSVNPFCPIEHVKRIVYAVNPETGEQTAKIYKAKTRPEDITVTLSPVIKAEIIEE